MGIATSQPEIPSSWIRTQNEVQGGEKKQARLTPTIEALTMKESELRCPFASCVDEISRYNPLERHIKKHVREFAKVDGELTIEYHCPTVECSYSVWMTEKSFPNLQKLKQHYRKVHLPKDFKCDKCTLSFGTLGFLNYHKKFCGQGFICSCGKNYKNIVSLRSHAKRKSHSLGDEYKRSTWRHSDEKQALPTSTDQPEVGKKNEIKQPAVPAESQPNAKLSKVSLKKPAVTSRGTQVQFSVSSLIPESPVSSFVYFVLPSTFPGLNSAELLQPTQPKLDFGTQTGQQMKRSSKSQHSQTDPSSASVSTHSQSMQEPFYSRMKRKRSAETQTGRVRVRISAETQTSVVTKRRRCTRKKLSTQTQTQAMGSKSPSPVKANAVPASATTSSSTSPAHVVQTTFQNQFDLFNEMEEVHCQTQTEPDLLLGEHFDFVDLDGEEVSDILRFVESKSAETQTQTLPTGNLEQTVPTSSSPYSPSSNSNFSFQEEGSTTGLFEDILCGDSSVGNAYLETMDNETQTQFAAFTKSLR